MTRIGFLLLIAGCAGAQIQPSMQSVQPNLQLDVHVRNDLEECVQLTPRGLVFERNVVLLDVHLRMLRSLGECGCKSAALTYRVRRDEREHGTTDAVGRLNTLRPQLPLEEEAYVVLTTDALLLAQAKTATVDVTCTAPE